MFEGAFTALVTPFRNGKVDTPALVELGVALIGGEGGVDGLVPCGTTGEAPALSEEEFAEIVQKVIELVRGRVPVVVGTGSNNLDRTIRATRAAAEMKAAGALIVTPYYNKPSQEGLYRYYKSIASEVDIPIVLYNVPGRTGVNLLPATVLRLAGEVPSIKAVKEASGSLAQVEEILAGGFPVLSGDDALTFPILSLGGAGVISVIANCLPGEVATMCRLHREGDREGALRIHRKLTPLMHALFIESNPVPVKAALRMMGRGNGEVRPPLAPLMEESERKLTEVVRAVGLLREG